MEKCINQRLIANKSLTILSSFSQNPPARLSRLLPKPRDDLTSCNNCGRNFAEDRIDKHQEICFKTASKKRKTFDMAKQRLEGTDAESFVKRKGRGQRGVSDFFEEFNLLLIRMILKRKSEICVPKVL